MLPLMHVIIKEKKLPRISSSLTMIYVYITRLKVLDLLVTI